MKIRIMGIKEELDLAVSYYKSLEKESYVKSVVVSNFYQNRGSFTVADARTAEVVKEIEEIFNASEKIIIDLWDVKKLNLDSSRQVQS